MKQNRNNFSEQKPPVNEGAEYTGRIDSVGEKGDGVMRINGFVVFVPGVAKGDYVKVKITKVLAKVSFGTLVEKVDPPKNEDRRPLNLKPKKEGPSKEVAELLTTEGDSEDFGEDDE